MKVCTILRSMRHTRFLSLAQGLYIAGLVLGVLFIIPSPWFPLQLGKLAVTALCMLLAALFFVVGGGARSLFKEKGPYFVALGALLPLSYALSYYFSIDRSVGLSGYAVEADTILFILSGFFVYVLGIGLFRNQWSSRVLVTTVAVVAAVAMVFQYVVIIFGSAIFPAVFSDRAVNLVGKWNDLGVLTGLILLLVLVSFEMSAMSLRRRATFVVMALLATMLLVIINFPLIWTLLLGFCVVIALWSFITKRPSDSSSYLQMVPWAPVAGVVVSGMLLLWGSLANTGITKVFPVSALEVRPSVASSLDVVKAAHGSSFKHFLVGTGPQTFNQQWLAHKPVSVNQSPFWNLDFNVGFSTFVTAIGTVGLLGALSWLVPLVLSLLALVYVLRAAHFSPREKLFGVYLATSSIYLWCTTLFYVPSQNLILLAFALAGATVGFAFSKRQAEGAVEHAPSQMLRVGMVLVSVALVALSGWTVQNISRRYLAEAHTNQGLLELQQGRSEVALTFAAKSQAVEKMGDNLRLGVDAGLARLQQLAQTGPTPTEQQKNDFVTQAQKTIPQGQLAIQLNPRDYRAYVSLGRVYDFLNSLGFTGAYENAKQMYDTAAKLNPTSPQIPLLVARLEAARGNLPAVQAALQQALTLKPDYTDAILFVVQLNVAQKDIPNAIIASQAAVRSAPGVPAIWFELGLLYYSAGDTANAIPALEEAIKRQADYANAKYFLGLSYATQNRNQDAIQQFVDLEKTNPDNQEVKLILSNLRAGKSPFDGAKPPVTDTPTDRTTAPISQ